MFIRHSLLFKIKFHFFETKWKSSNNNTIAYASCLWFIWFSCAYHLSCRYVLCFFMILSLHCARVRFYDCYYYSWLSCLSCKFRFAALRAYLEFAFINILVICRDFLMISIRLFCKTCQQQLNCSMLSLFFLSSYIPLSNQITLFKRAWACWL